MEVDLDRWSSLLDDYRDCGANLVRLTTELRAAQETWSRARAMRDDFKGREAPRDHRPRADLVEAYQAAVGELDERVEQAQAAVARIEKRTEPLARRQAQLGAILRACRAWAVSSGVVLPDPDREREQAATATLVAGPAGRSFGEAMRPPAAAPARAAAVGRSGPGRISLGGPGATR
jgi:hypothetical protein